MLAVVGLQLERVALAVGDEGECRWPGTGGLGWPWEGCSGRREPEAIRLVGGAQLQGANLNGAHLAGVDLSKALGLSWDQLKLAVDADQAHLPAGLADVPLAGPRPRRGQRGRTGGFLTSDK